MLILSEGEEVSVVDALIRRGINLVVAEDCVLDRLNNSSLYNEHFTDVGFCNFYEFFQLADSNYFYISGAIAIVIPQGSEEVERLLNAIQILSEKGINIILISNEDQYVYEWRKPLSELIEGPCKRNYIINEE